MTDVTSFPGERTRSLVSAIVALSPYRKALEPIIDDIARVAVLNDQIRESLDRVDKRSRFATTGRVSKRDLGQDKAGLFMFLEHVRFAAPSFLTSVGEGKGAGMSP